MLKRVGGKLAFLVNQGAGPALQFPHPARHPQYLRRRHLQHHLAGALLDNLENEAAGTESTCILRSG